MAGRHISGNAMLVAMVAYQSNKRSTVSSTTPVWKTRVPRYPFATFTFTAKSNFFKVDGLPPLEEAISAESKMEKRYDGSGMYVPVF